MTAKRILCLLLALWLCVSLAACADSEADPEQNQPPYLSFTDDLGRTVSLPSQPKKVAVLFSSYAEIWTLAGGDIAVTVGEAVTRGLAPEHTQLVDIGAGKVINTELLLSYQPDFVIASADIDGQVSATSVLQEANIPAAYFRVETFSDYLRMLDICTRITGDRTAFATYGTNIESQIQKRLSSISTEQQAKFLFVRAGSSIVKAKTAKEHFACQMLDELGGHNIADEATLLLDGLSVETILKENPSYIFIATMGDEEAAIANMERLLTSDAWSKLDAVREGRIFYLPKDLFQYKPNHRWAEAYDYLAEILYESQV